MSNLSKISRDLLPKICLEVPDGGIAKTLNYFLAEVYSTSAKRTWWAFRDFCIESHELEEMELKKKVFKILLFHKPPRKRIVYEMVGLKGGGVRGGE